MITNYFLLFLFYFTYFASIGIFVWVIFQWLVMFRVISPRNTLNSWIQQMIMPFIRPFSWARIGMVDLSPIVAIVVLNVANSWIRSML